VKHLITLAALLVSSDIHSGEEMPNRRPEDVPAFVSMATVAAFEKLCLLTYSDRKKFSEWQQENEKNRIAAPEDFQMGPTDDVYRITAPPASLVLNAAKGNSCTIFSAGTSRDSVEKLIEQMLRIYIQQGKGGKLKIEDNSINGRFSKYFAVLSPGDVSYIEVVYSDSIAEDGVHSSAITGATRRRGAR